MRSRVADGQFRVGQITEAVADLDRTHRRLLERGWSHDDAVAFQADGLVQARDRRRDPVRAAEVRWKVADPARIRPPFTIPVTGGLVAYPVRDGLDRTERLTGQQILDGGGLAALFERTRAATLAEPVHPGPMRWERFTGPTLRGDVYTASRLIDLDAVLDLVQIKAGPAIVAAPTHQDLWFCAVPPQVDWREVAWAVTAAGARRIEEVGDILFDGAWRLEPDRRLVRVAARQDGGITILT